MKNYFFILLFLCFCLSNAQIVDFNHINFTRADNIAKLNEGESLKSLPLLTHKLTHKLPTDVEKFRAIYTWICLNIKGDDNQHKRVSRNRKKYLNDSTALLKWNNSYKKVAFKKLLKRKKTMCTGYAYLVKELAQLAGIESKIIDGYGRSVTSNIDSLEMPNHSWNAVKLNNKWYLCDATWSSGYMNGNGKFIKDYNDGYFLTEPNLFAKNHYPLDKKWLLNSNKSTQTFITSPLVYGETFKHKISSYTPTTMRVITDKEKPIQFEFQSLKNTSNKNISLVFLFGNEYKKLKIYDLINQNSIVKFKHKFQRTGYYDVHLKVDDDIVATYTIKVTS